MEIFRLARFGIRYAGAAFDQGVIVAAAQCVMVQASQARFGNVAPPSRLESGPSLGRDCADPSLFVSFAFQGNGSSSILNHPGQYRRATLISRRHRIVTHGLSPACDCPGCLICPGIFRQGKQADNLPAGRIRIHKAGRHLWATIFLIGSDDRKGMRAKLVLIRCPSGAPEPEDIVSPLGYFSCTSA